MKFLHYSLIAIASVAIVPAASAQTFATINGKTVTCKEAFAFRDGPLYQGVVLLESKDEAERDLRRKEVIAELTAQIDKLRADWDQKSATLKKEIAVNLATYAATSTIKYFAKASIAKSGISPTDKQYAEAAMARSVDIQGVLVSSAFKVTPDAASLANLPLGTLALAVPAVAPAAAIYEIGTTGISVAVSYGDLKIGSAETYAQIAELEKAIRKVAERTTNVRRQAFFKIKEEIDTKCK